MTEDDAHAQPDRRHPHRLADEWYRLPDEVVFVTSAACTTGPLFEDRTARAIVEAIARMGHRYGIGIVAYRIMPDHLHVVVEIGRDGADLRKWVRYTKRQCARVLEMPGMWQRSYWDRHARADDDVGAMVEYVLANPVRHGLVAGWHEWPWSWSRWHPQTRGPAPDSIDAWGKGSATRPAAGGAA